MNSRSSSVSFTKKQLEFLMKKTGAVNPQEAIEIFVAIINKENIDPMKIPLYIDKLIEREGPAK